LLRALPVNNQNGLTNEVEKHHVDKVTPYTRELTLYLDLWALNRPIKQKN